MFTEPFQSPAAQAPERGRATTIAGGLGLLNTSNITTTTTTTTTTGGGAGAHSPVSSQSHLSPRLLTPENDIDPPPHAIDGGLVFVKQLLPARTPSVGAGIAKLSAVNAHTSGSGNGNGNAIGHGRPAHTANGRSTSVTRGFPRARSAGTDTDGLSDDPYGSGVSSAFPDTPRSASPGKGQLSLLTALLSSPEHQPMRRAKAGVPGQGQQGPADHTLSSVPSTAFSSPVSTHGILQRAVSRKDKEQERVDRDKEKETNGTSKPHGILRRGSVDEASDVPDRAPRVGLSVGSSCLLEKRLMKVEEKRERVGWADDVKVDLARAPSASSTRPCLKFAVAAKPAHAPPHGSTSASEAGDVSRRSSSSHRPASPFAKERKVQESLDEAGSSSGSGEDDAQDDDAQEDDATEEESPVNLPGYQPGPGGLHVHGVDDVEDDASDAGYHEDEEDGMFSDEEETTAFNLDRIKPGKFPFARSTNYWNRRASREDTSPGTSPPPAAPAFVPPPNRRGRGHIRMAEQPTSGKETKGCSRHCSPPPRSRSASGAGQGGLGPKLDLPIQLEAPPPAASPSARRMKRPFDRPRTGTKMSKGSPMPPRVASDTDEDEDGEEEVDGDEEEDAAEEEQSPSKTPVVARGGWRSDDAVFYGPKSRVSRPASRDVSESHGQAMTSANVPPAPPKPPVSAPPVFSETEDDSLADEEGVRGFLRRASEHLPMFRRPSQPQAAPLLAPAPAPAPAHAGLAPPLSIAMDGGSERSSTDSRGTPVSIPRPANNTCRPILDDTPALASSAPRAADGGLAHRLEKTLGASVTVAQLSRPPAMSRPSDGTSSREGAQSQGQQGLGRTTSVSSGKVKFASTPIVQPRASLDASRDRDRERERRMMSPALGREIEEEARRRRGVRGMDANGTGSGSGEGGSSGIDKERVVRAVPMRCPRAKLREGEADLGWTDGALLSIRKNLGKVEL